MIKKKILDRIKNNSNLRSIFILASGTGFAQIFTILVAPIIARLYTTTEFGIYAIYYSILTIVSGFICLEYGNAIILSDTKKKSHVSIQLCSLISISISFILFLLIYFFKDSIPYVKKEVSQYLYIIPVTAFLNSLNTLFYFYFLRMDMLKYISKNKIIMAIVSSITQIVVGFCGVGALGLILANICSLVFCNLLYLFKFFKTEKSFFSSFSSIEIINVAKEFKRFPLIGMWGNLLNIITLQIPEIFLSSFANLSYLGQYSMANRVVSMPIGFIAVSIQETFRKNAAKSIIDNGNIVKVYKSTLKIVFYSGLVLLLCLIVVFPSFFLFIFGEKWTLASEIIKIMSILYITKYIVAPLSYTFFVCNKQNYDLLWQIGLFIITILSLYGVYKFKTKNIDCILIIYVIFVSIWYLVNLLLSYNLMLKKNK